MVVIIVVVAVVVMVVVVVVVRMFVIVLVGVLDIVAYLVIDDVVVVVVDAPQGGNAYGSTVAVPVAKQIIDALLVLEKIPPSTEQTHSQPAKG